MNKVLVANRGEIAVRIIRACREYGVPVATVVSEADTEALHARVADQAVLIGPAAARESYLSVEAIVEAAKKVGADAVHPGYGFLAESPRLASAVEDAGLTFIGPTAASIARMGDKLAARRLMQGADVPVVPGATVEASDAEAVRAEIERMGLPVILKAAGGGGGKGMRLVRSMDEVDGALETASSEAASAFGDPRIYVEKWLDKSRHVEFQILADGNGKAVHLFERECSIQRRHQKVIEETPCTALDPDLRRRMGEAAVRAALAAEYRGAGTVEFLLGSENEFYFLEMNTRIQVEHPITEMVVGVDLVEAQLKIADGKPLDIEQEKLFQRGHAIECRIYAEDPDRNFMPCPGQILIMREPGGAGVRLDSGVVEGSEVPIYYDPLLMKLVTWATDRETCRRRMLNALGETVILGVKTVIPFLVGVLEHPEFIAGRTYTQFLEDHTVPADRARSVPDSVLAVAGALAARGNTRGRVTTQKEATAEETPWQTLGHWRR